VAIAPFANRTGDGSLDGLGSMATASIAKLLAGEGVSVAADDTGGRDAGREGLSRGAALDRARRAGAGFAVSGDLRVVGNDLVFQGQLTDVAAGRDVRSFDAIAVPRGTPNAIAPLIEQRVVGTTLFILRGAGGMTGFSREMISTLVAPSYDAYREFQAGIENFGTNMREAERHFEKALEADPQLWWCLGWLVPTYEVLGEFDKAERILAKVRPNVPPNGKTTIEYFSARLGGRLVEAYTAARAARDAMPTRLPTATVAAWAARDIGRPQEALDVLLPITTPDPNVNASAWRGWVETVAQAYHMLGRYEEERGVGDRAVAAVPGSALGRLIQARALSAQGRVEELGKVLEACFTVPPSARPRPGLIIVTAAWELRAHGHPEDSLKVAAQALRWLDGLDTTLASSVPMQELRGDALALLARWAEASATHEKLAAAAPGSTWTRSEIGVVAAKRGDVATAHRASDALAQMNRPYIRGAHTYGRARIAAALGERDRAVDLLREAFAEGQALAWVVHGDYAFERLRGYAPFEQLTSMNQKP
jgi:tetratricopeptide (TPR) repeat protein